MTSATGRTHSLTVLAFATLALLLAAPFAAAQKDLVTVTGAACADTPPTLTCGGEATGVITNDDCFFGDQTRFDIYEFSGQAGDVVGISLDSTDFQPIVALYPPGATVPVVVSPVQSGVNASAGYQLTETGTWQIAVNTVSVGERGSYTVSLDCFTGASAPDFGPCTDGATEVCLNDDRFRVEAFWETRDGNSGDAHTEEMTEDTGYLWFFRPANVEAVVKVLDGCPVNNRYWVFAGGLTNVMTVMRVTDTEEDEVRLYFNPQGQPFKPIQDTDAFATCP